MDLKKVRKLTETANRWLFMGMVYPIYIILYVYSILIIYHVQIFMLENFMNSTLYHWNIWAFFQLFLHLTVILLFVKFWWNFWSEYPKKINKWIEENSTTKGGI